MIEFYISTLKVKFSVITWHFSHHKNGRFFSEKNRCCVIAKIPATGDAWRGGIETVRFLGSADGGCPTGV